MLRLDDEQLIEVLKTLKRSERRVIELCVQKGLRSEEALRAVRKLKARLKAGARRKRDSQHEHAGLSKHDVRFFDLLN